MDLLKEIGAILGFVAFGGLAVLAFLTFQQARHLRRLRQWAGRSPERAEAAAERAAALSSEATVPRLGGHGAARGEERPRRFDRLRGELAFRYEELDRRSPASPKILGGALLALIVAVVIVIGPLGLVGGSSDSGTNGAAATDAKKKPKPPVVAVLNGTAPEGGVGVPGTAKEASRYVKDAGFRVGKLDDATSFAASVVMYGDGAQSQAKKLARKLEDVLGPTGVEAITPEIEELIGKADLALIVGQDDQGLAA